MQHNHSSRLYYDEEVAGQLKYGCVLSEIEWKLSYFRLDMKVGESVRSDFFIFADQKWCLDISVGVPNKERQQYISLFLQPWDFLKSECRVIFSFGLKKTDGSMEIFTKELDHTFQKGLKGYGYPMFFSKEELLKRQSEFLRNDALTIVCILKRGDFLDVSPKPRNMKLEEIEKLSWDFKNLLIDKKACDITLQVKGKLFEAHKSILIARSPVFAAMFEHDMAEKKTSTVVIPDCDEQTFDLFLQYLYSGIASDISFNRALRLYTTADKYDVPELKAFCLKYLEKNLTIEDAIDAIILADRYDETDFMSLMQDFFNLNLEAIVSTRKWETLMHNNSSLANKLIVAMSSSVKL